MLPNQVVDTRVLPPAERFAFWYALVAQETAPVHISSGQLDNFVAYVQAIDLGRIRMTSLRYPSLDAIRPTKLVRSAEGDVYQLTLPLTGHSTLIQDRAESTLEPGKHFTLLDPARRHVARHRADGAGLATTITVQIPHAALPLAPDRLRRLLATPIPSHLGVGGLLVHHLRSIAAHPEQFEPAQAEMLGGVAVDLLTATLAQYLDIEETLSPEARHTTLRARVVDFIDRHLDSNELSPGSVAAAHHISLRSLHRLFEAEATTVAELIRAKRLEQCRRDLGNPLLRQPVHVIAARWGFPDRAHFSRLFRAHYGRSPQEYRTGVARQNG
ncbi:AraC-like DNA-binding protein [Micromonospora vinacea]|uniref:AraC-like DNA-binding protein n=1 Tax=Micromonospora vinacea TaxID=709878 RepID=A0ABS0K833_9ACTN|nr:helix-turn-helix domain-containing protein [Micromonospora vinacea]MBG6104779.1 AraC-like DNA-binding protein [Micromonospora vinacea]WTA64544.1 helix-turn-helix domain-containing protein [Micromonospora sp. NBC_00855]